MKPQNAKLDHQPATPSHNLIRLLIIVMDWVFFISAPAAGVFFVFLLSLVPLILASMGAYRPPEGYIFAPFLCPLPFGILLGAFIIKSINWIMAQGKKQRNLALAIKVSVGIIALVCISCFISIIRSGYENLNIMLLVSIASSILSILAGWYIYKYLERLTI